MNHPDQLKWDQRYQNSSGVPAACTVLQQNLHLLPSQGKALDLACGLGGNALLLARQGLDTQGWDISAVAIEKLQQQAINEGVTLQSVSRDITAEPPTAESFDVIVVSYFLERQLAPALCAALKPHGLLFYQTFTEHRVSERGPQNPAYRLKENELLHLFADLTLRYYREEGITGNTTQGFRDEAMLIAQKG